MEDEDESKDDVNPLQKYQSSVLLNELSTVVAEEARSQSVVIVERPAIQEDVIDASAKKSAIMLAKNIDATSKVDVTQDLVEEIDETVDRAEKERLGITLDSPSLEALKGEQLIRFRQRGSIAPVRRSSMFPIPGARSSSVPEPLRKHSDREPSAASSASSLTVDSSAQSSLHSDTQMGQIGVIQPTLLSPVEAALLVCILEECVNQLDVLGSVIPARIDPTWDDGAKTMEEKYGVPDEPRIIFREDMGLPPLISSWAEKMQRERTYACRILNETLRSLRYGREFDCLEREVDDIAKMNASERSLEATCRLWQNQVDQLRDEIENEKVTNEREIKRMTSMASRVNAHVDTAILVNGSRLGYVERWENARLEQQNLLLSLKEQELTKEINHCLKMQSVDRIISGEVCAYLEEDTNKLQTDIEVWTHRYNEELVQRQQEIDELKERVEEQKLELQELYILRDEYQAIIDEHNARMERERIEAEYQAKLYRAAVIIQSAWRGYMVRHQLGPYKNLRSRLRKRKKLARIARRKAAALKKKREMEAKTKKAR